MAAASYGSIPALILAHLRANLRAASLASVPELQKKTRSANEFSTRRWARRTWERGGWEEGGMKSGGGGLVRGVCGGGGGRALPGPSLSCSSHAPTPSHLRLRVVQVGDVAQRGRLLLHRTHPARVGVTQRVDRDAGGQVKEGAPARVGQAGASAGHEHRVRRAGVGLEDEPGFGGDDVRGQGVGGGRGGRGGGGGGDLGGGGGGVEKNVRAPAEEGRIRALCTWRACARRATLWVHAAI